jgi:hypothetical protein
MKRFISKYEEVLYYIGIIIFFVFLFLFVTGFNDPPENYIIWKKERKLGISDFKQVDFQIRGNEVASSCTGLIMGYDEERKKSTIYAVFDKNKSYWNAGRIRNRDWILNHEQGHFDIAHYIATLANDEIEHHAQRFNDNLRIFEKYRIQLDSLQDLYDKETSHSEDSINQRSWNNTIKNLIKY